MLNILAKVGSELKLFFYRCICLGIILQIKFWLSMDCTLDNFVMITYKNIQLFITLSLFRFLNYIDHLVQKH